MDRNLMLLWAIIVAVIGATISVLLLTDMVITTDRQHAVVQMVGDGANPVEAACAVDALPRRSPVCSIRAAIR